MVSKRKVAIAADHGGYALKKAIQENFSDIEWVDLGTDSTDSVDYPDFGYKLGEMVNAGDVETGVAVCGSGIGISMSLNRFKNVRAAVCHDTTTAKLTRIDNNANVICIGARVVGQAVVFDMIKTFFETEFETGGRHERRVNKLFEKGEN